MPDISSTENTKRFRSYAAGRTAAKCKIDLSTSELESLRTDHDFWQGFHAARPLGLRLLEADTLQDPTRPGGSCVARRPEPPRYRP